MSEETEREQLVELLSTVCPVGTLLEKAEFAVKTIKNAGAYIHSLDPLVFEAARAAAPLVCALPRAEGEQRQPPEGAQLWGELWIDAEGEGHFICHTQDDDFLKTRAAFEQFIIILREQLANQQQCPFYTEAAGNETKEST